MGLYKKSDLHSDTRQNIKMEGLYVYGGKTQSGEAVSTLKILRVGQKPLQWITPDTMGKPPMARYQHTMNYCSRINCLVVYGGRNDRVAETKEGGRLGGFMVLWLENLNWVDVSTAGSKPTHRFSHCSIMFGSQLLVFGGVDYYTYLKADIEVVEVDQNAAHKLAREYEQGRFNKVAEMQQFQDLYGQMDYEDPKYNSKKDETPKSGFRSFLPIQTRSSYSTRMNQT